MEKVSAVWGVVRHALSLAGGALVALGVVSSADWTSVLTNGDAIVGGILTVVAVGASIISKIKGFDFKSIFGGK